MSKVTVLLLAAGLLMPRLVEAEVCTTQSQMKPADRDGLAAAAMGLATKVQAADVAGLRGATVAELGKDFSGIEGVVGSTAPKLKGAVLTVDQVYLLDGSELKRGADGSAPDAQFFCNLNKSVAEVDFLIPQLPPGRYGFAIVETKSATPWRLSFLLREDQGRWAMAGFYPRASLAAGHDGLWYWTEARQMVKRKEQWSAWLYYQQAESLLRPANFVQSSHLEKLKNEQSAGAPPALSEGVSAEAPLVVKGADGVEYHFTGLGVDDSLGKEKVFLVAHLKVEATLDTAVARKRNADAMNALVGAYPELRKAFAGVWLFAETAGQNPFVTEQAMNEVR
ncbi:hypothetical protein [Granulicella sp. dw_53]|uniref:hypothetical protein n=1 Tax=Granulicella sp. dw_53 TaxID=2719792 RepID=UPI001BD26E6B|nr:hypothetical protein [Granulicella sp. dw_53]